MPKQKSPKKSKILRKTSKKSHKTRKSDAQKKIALRLIILGVTLVTVPLLYYSNQTIQLTFLTPNVKAVTETSSLPSPSEISIPAVNLQLPVRGTKITNGVWEIAEGGVSYLSTSARPGQKGGIILYAHNTPERFGPLIILTPGKTIILRTEGGKNHIYTIEKTLEVYPHQMEVFEQKDERLVMYTCSGFADLKRFIVIAKPSE